MPQLLANRMALVTGGCRGIGRAIVECFAGAGSSGIAADIATAAADWRPLEGYAVQVADVTDEKQIAHAIAEVDRRFGRLDIVVANAGVVPPWHETEELDLGEWDRVFAVNARGVAATI